MALIVVSLTLQVKGLELEELYNNDIYKISVDYKAPLKAPEETLINLKRLLRIVPEIRWTEDDLKNPKEALKHEIFHIFRRDLEFLISVAKPKEESCNHDYIYSLYNINDDPNLLTSQTKDKNYGDNMMNYLRTYEEKLVNYCGQLLAKKMQSLPTDQLEAVQGAAENVFPHGVTNVFFHMNEKTSDLENGLIVYLMEKVHHTLSKDLFKRRYFHLELSCNNFLTTTESTTFLMLALEKDHFLADYIMKNPTLIKAAMGVKICSFVTGKGQYKKLKDTAGIGFKSKIKQLL